MPRQICEKNSYMTITQDVLVSYKHVPCIKSDEGLDLSERFIELDKKILVVD